MDEKTRLQTTILTHWQSHCPRMVEELRNCNRLQEAISHAEARATEVLYQLLSVEKMQYQDAWEMAMQECLPSTSSLKKGRPATSG
jgi:hypothetical protein